MIVDPAFKAWWERAKSFVSRHHVVSEPEPALGFYSPDGPKPRTPYPLTRAHLVVT